MAARILIIEDDPGSRELASYLLDAAGYTTITASDGGTGLQLALDERTDLILCDLHLPVMNGIQIAQHLLGAPAWRRVPLIALTASSMVGDREATLAAGFDDHLPKPITPQTFATQIEAYLPPGLRSRSKRYDTAAEDDDG